MEQDLDPDIDEQTWSRFRWYAGLVREMKGYVHTDPIGIHRNAWTLLASRLHEEPLLPSLRRLHMPANTEDIVPFLFSLSPTLRIFTLDFESEDITTQDRDFLHPFLALISDPSGLPLETTVCHWFSLEEDGEELVQHFRKCARLGKLEELDLSRVAYNIDHSAVAALSRLPSLHTLRAFLRWPGHSTSSLFTFTGFARLRHLEISLFSLPALSGVLTTSGLRTSLLQSIELSSDARTIDDTHTPLSISECQRHLSLIRAALPAQLESFRLWLTYQTRSELPLPLSTWFDSFLTLGRLKSFEVSFRWGYVPHVTDDDLRALAVAWPQLEVLYIGAWEMRFPKLSTARPPTAAGLAELARRCPQLRRLTLPALDVSALPELSTLPPEGHKGVRFVDLNALVHCDSGVAVEDVAEVLDRLFPQQEEYSRIGRGDRLAESWLAVRDAMRARRAARI